MFLFWLIVIVVLGILIFSFIQFKKIKLPNVFLITGGVKTGKSYVSVWLAIKRYRLNLLIYYLKKYVFGNLLFFIEKGKNLKETEKPMLYSNIPLAKVKYNDLTIDIIKRKVRIPYKSVVFIDEASLIADNMTFNDKILNEEVQLFVKLFGHYTKGGYLIYNTQDMKDMHFGFKRCTSTMLYIQSKRKIPLLFTIFKVRELISLNDDDVQTSNNFETDIEDTCKTLIVSNKWGKYYDCYAYSYLTDNLQVQVNYKKKIHKKKQKANYIVSFKKFLTFKNERKEKE